KDHQLLQRVVICLGPLAPPNQSGGHRPTERHALGVVAIVERSDTKTVDAEQTAIGVFIGDREGEYTIGRPDPVAVPFAVAVEDVRRLIVVPCGKVAQIAGKDDGDSRDAGKVPARGWLTVWRPQPQTRALAAWGRPFDGVDAEQSMGRQLCWRNRVLPGKVAAKPHEREHSAVTRLTRRDRSAKSSRERGCRDRRRR